MSSSLRFSSRPNSISKRRLEVIAQRPQIRLRKNVPLAGLSTFRIGGRATLFCQVAAPVELVKAVDWARRRRMPYKIVAAGSNIVFPDTTLKALLIRVVGGRLFFEGTSCMVDAGVSLAEVIERAVRRGFQGLETLSGIPGTIGGAVVGNAGAYGHSVSEVVDWVEVWDGRKRRILSRSQCVFAYRESVFKMKRLVLLRVGLRFRHGNARRLRRITRKIIAVRSKKYRPGLRCPGSFFKNVLVKDVSQKSLARIDQRKIIDGKIPAGHLLEEVGAKGMRVGGIVIARFHGNLFINRGGGSARDVRLLARDLKNRVRRKFGIHLEEEIRYF